MDAVTKYYFPQQPEDAVSSPPVKESDNSKSLSVRVIESAGNGTKEGLQTGKKLGSFCVGTAGFCAGFILGGATSAAQTVYDMGRWTWNTVKSHSVSQ